MHTAGNVVTGNCPFRFKWRFSEPPCSEVLPHPQGPSKERGAMAGRPRNVSMITGHPQDCEPLWSQPFDSLCNARWPADTPLLRERPLCGW